MFFFLLLNGLKQALEFGITGSLCIFSILFHTAFLLGLEILNDCGETAYVIGEIVENEEKVILE